MSWASHEWKDGLPLKALSKIEELETHRDRLRKELQQRQLQIDTIEQVMTKQRQKFDIEKMAHSTLTADNKILMETCEQLEKKRHRLEHDLQMKEAQLLNMEDSYIQTKKLLDAEIHKSVVLERQVEKLDGAVNMMETKEKRTLAEMKKVKDMLQDQHWHDVAQISAEKDTTSQLKVELMRAHNRHLMSRTGLSMHDINDKYNNGDYSCTKESHPSHESNSMSGDSAELMQLREKVVALTNELREKDQQCQDAEAECNSFKEKFKGSLLMHQQQVDELSEKLRQLQTEHKQMVEQCSSRKLFDKIDASKLPLPPGRQLKSLLSHRTPDHHQSDRRLAVCCQLDHQLINSKSLTTNATSDTNKFTDKKWAAERDQLLATIDELRSNLSNVTQNNSELNQDSLQLNHKNSRLTKANNLLESANIQMESEITQLVQKVDSSEEGHAQTGSQSRSEVELKSVKAKYRRMVCENASTLEQQKELTSRLQHDYNQALERNTQLQVQLVDARRKLELEKQRAASEKKKLEYHIKELKTEISSMKGKVVDTDVLKEKIKRDFMERRKTLVAESHSLASKLQAVTLSRDRLQIDLDQMTSRWKSLEKQVNAKVEMLTMFGEKLQQAEGVANDLESKFEMKMKTVEAEHGRADILKANLENTQVSLQDVTQKYNALKMHYDAVCRKLEGGEHGHISRGKGIWNNQGHTSHR